MRPVRGEIDLFEKLRFTKTKQKRSLRIDIGDEQRGEVEPRAPIMRFQRLQQRLLFAGEVGEA